MKYFIILIFILFAGCDDGSKSESQKDIDADKITVENTSEKSP